MSGRALKVAVEFRFSAVSCPGVHLPCKDDVCLSVDCMEQQRRSESRPAVFPMIFDERMTFEKIFRDAVNPGDIAVMLEYETVRIRLVQLTPPVGGTLACFEEDTLRFLFPEPRLVPSFSGKDREVLMTRTPYFPGIAPRLEFSTKTTITQCPPSAEIQPNLPMVQRSMNRRRASSSPRSCSALRLSFASPSAERRSPPQHGPYSSRTLDAESSEEESSPSQTPPDSSQAPAPGGVSRSEWEEVHERVRGLLTTPKAVRRLLHEATRSEGEELWG